MSLHVWHGLERSLIDEAIDRWPTRLHACAGANGGHLNIDICFSLGILDEFYASHHGSYSKSALYV